MKPYDILKVMNALVKLLYYVTEYTVLQSCLLIMQEAMIQANLVKSMKMEEKVYTEYHSKYK